MRLIKLEVVNYFKEKYVSKYIIGDVLIIQAKKLEDIS